MKSSENRDRKTALVLGGGGSRGAYEVGVWQALREMGHTFDMVYGTSIGAINGAMVVQNKFQEALTLWKDIDTTTAFELESETDFDSILEVIQKKGVSLGGLQKIAEKYIDEDVIRKSTIDYGLVTVELSSLKSHYLTKKDIPKGKIMDYICASASLYPAIHAFDIDGKKFIDGGFADVVPVGMAIDNGATDIIAVNLNSIGLDPKKPLPKGSRIIEISSKWDLGNIMIFNRDNAETIIRFGYLDTFKAYDVYYGEYYAFVKDAFRKSEIEVAEKAAIMFELDPEIIYKKSIFLIKLKAAISNHIYLNSEYVDNEKRFSNFILVDKILDVITKFKAEVKPISITLALAKELVHKKDSQSFWNNPAVSHLIRDELEVAQYLLRYRLYG